MDWENHLEKTDPKNRKNRKNQSEIAACEQKKGSPFVPPQYVMRPPVTEYVSLHSKSLCKNIARASRGCK